MKTMKQLSFALALALGLGIASPASADCTKIGPANGAVTQVMTAMQSGSITPLIAVDRIAAALIQIGLEKEHSEALTAVVADLKKKSDLTAADVAGALEREFKPRVAAFATKHKCG